MNVPIDPVQHAAFDGLETSQFLTARDDILEVANGTPLAISTRGGFGIGTDFLIQLTKVIKKRKAWFSNFLRPAKEAKQAAADAFKAQKSLCDSALAPLTLPDTSSRPA